METLIDYFDRVGGYDWWVVAIELFLIGLVIYWAVDFLEGTRGERLFRGVIFILFAGVFILTLVVKQLEFERLEYLYKGFLIAVLIIAVAAFQPEIRRALIRIGQGNLRATPLQVANAMAAIARAGMYKPPRLFTDDANDSKFASIDLNISKQNLDVIHNGMSAVVSELGGTAYNEFAPSGLAGQGINVYGKTGSTEQPDNAWFAGFATDNAGRGIAIAVVVEGAQRGSSDAGPLARDIIQFCIEEGYIGDAGPTTE